MQTMDLESYRQYFNNANHFVKATGMEVTVLRDGYAELELLPSEMHRNVNDSVHGGMIFAMMDTVTGAASKTRGRATVTLDAAVHYIKPGRIDGTKLRAVAERVHHGEHTAVYESRVQNADGQTVATGSFTYYVLDQELTTG